MNATVPSPASLLRAYYLRFPAQKVCMFKIVYVALCVRLYFFVCLLILFLFCFVLCLFSPSLGAYCEHKVLLFVNHLLHHRLKHNKQWIHNLCRSNVDNDSRSPSFLAFHKWTNSTSNPYLICVFFQGL